MTCKDFEAINDTAGKDNTGPFIMRMRIGYTTYEVSVYFSNTSKETLGDKILSMASNEERWS